MEAACGLARPRFERGQASAVIKRIVFPIIEVLDNLGRYLQVMDIVENPHDRLFRKIESVKENCRDLIESTFPQELVDKLDLDTLENDNTSYLDKKLKEYYSDLVYNCKYKGSGKIKISILFEHKSYKPKNEYLQLLRYILAIWEHASENNEDIPVVLPVIFYHGETEWKKRTLLDYFKGADDNLCRIIPDFDYLLTDLNTFSDTDIMKVKFRNEINKVMALLFKHMRDEKYLRDRMKEIFSLVREYFEGDKSGVLVSFLVYIISITEIESEYISGCLEEVAPGGGEIAMTTAMKLIQKGREEGLQEGREEGRQEGILEQKYEDARKMLAKGYPVEDIVEITGLQEEKIRELKKSDE